MSVRQKKPEVHVIEQQGEVDEEEDDDHDHQQVEQKQQKPQQQSTSRDSLSSDLLVEKAAESITAKPSATSPMRFNDIIGLASYFDNYKEDDVAKVAQDIQKLTEVQQTVAKQIQAVHDNITVEEKIKEIRSVFQKAPLYILKLKGLKNRMAKVQAGIAAAAAGTGGVRAKDQNNQQV